MHFRVLFCKTLKHDASWPIVLLTPCPSKRRSFARRASWTQTSALSNDATQCAARVHCISRDIGAWIAVEKMSANSLRVAENSRRSAFQAPSKPHPSPIQALHFPSKPLTWGGENLKIFIQAPVPSTNCIILKAGIVGWHWVQDFLVSPLAARLLEFYGACVFRSVISY